MNNKEEKDTKKERPIFNKEQKMEYIEHHGSYQDALKNFFARLNKKEEEYQKDIADMNDSELMDTLASLNIRREDTRSHILSFFKGYINWAMLSGKTNNASSINSITAESIGTKDAVLNQMIGSPDDLESILDYSIPKDDNKYFLMPNRAARDRLIFWLLYSGMNLKELSMLKKTDIDINNKTVVTNGGKIYSVSHKIISLWKECSAALFIERKNGKATARNKADASEIIKSYLVENDYLFRPIQGKKKDDENNNKFFTERAFAVIIYKTLKQYEKNTKNEKRISPENIRNSGIFYGLYTLENEGKEITPEIIAESFDVNSDDIDSQEKLLSKTRKWRIDYEDWKLAFDYMN